MEKRIILVVICTSFITTFMGSALTLSIPSIENQFNISASAVSWVVTVYMLTCAALAIPFGLLADRSDRKKILSIGIFVFFASSICILLAGSYVILLFIRFGQGVGAAMIFSTIIAVLIDSCDEKERGKIIGYQTSSNYLGLSLGPVLGGFCNYYLGWKFVFYIAAAVSFAALVLAVSTFGKNIFKADKKSSTGVKSFHNKKKSFKLFKNPAYLCSNIAALINYGSIYAISYLVSIYLQVVMDYSSKGAGLILVASPVLITLLSPVAGRLSDKYSPGRLSAFGMAICLSSLLALAFTLENKSLAIIIIILSLSGIGCAFFSTPNTASVMKNVEEDQYGLANSVLSTMRSLGHGISMGIISLILGHYIGDLPFAKAPESQLIISIKMCFIIFSVITFVGIFMAGKHKS